MTKIAYERKKFSPDTLDAIDQINEILEDYAQQGYDLTLRQLFYQHVARALIPNTERSYKRLGNIVSDGRLSGLIDWDHIVDRTRGVRSLVHYDDPAHLIEKSIERFNVDIWGDQDNYVECWIEKDALVGVIAQVCTNLDMPYFSCRGYTSQTAMWDASRRLLERLKQGKAVTILHLGDHDPSGIDMTRDIADRLWTFCATDYLRHRLREDPSIRGDSPEAKAKQQDVLKWVQDNLHVNRIALTMDQVNQYGPPPNPAKVTDSRSGVNADGTIRPGSYIDLYGPQSWELDALDPPVLTQLVQDAAEALIDGARWDVQIERENEGRTQLRQVSKEWTGIIKRLNGGKP